MIRRCLSKSIIKSTKPYSEAQNDIGLMGLKDGPKLHTTEMRIMRWARSKTKRTTPTMNTSGEKPTSNQ